MVQTGLSAQQMFKIKIVGQMAALICNLRDQTVFYCADKLICSMESKSDTETKYILIVLYMPLG